MIKLLTLAKAAGSETTSVRLVSFKQDLLHMLQRGGSDRFT